MMMKTVTGTHRVVQTPDLPCPGCGTQGQFEYGGQQHLPAKIARQMGVPSPIVLWHCGECHSTFTDISFNS